VAISGSEWLVVVAGAGAILLVNWYFFLAGRRAVVAATGGASAAAQVIVVDGGYSPALLRAKVGQPLRLVFDRRDKGACSDEVVFPDFGVRRFLPTGEKTTVEITPSKAGRYDFTCGMSMHRGAIIAEE
jgi:plastocyanin domain-containing protein